MRLLKLNFSAIKSKHPQIMRAKPCKDVIKFRYIFVESNK